MGEVKSMTVQEWKTETTGQAACEALRKNGFKAEYVPDAAAALECLAACVKPGMRVGFGGSMTIAGLGARERFRGLGAELLDHSASGLSPEQKLEVMRAQLTCDLFVTSSNAVTLEGEILNVDGNGNRVAALSFGPKKTMVVVGVNKIVRDLDEAFSRLETRASPMNNRRLDLPNP
jgi:hypothetical protein